MTTSRGCARASAPPIAPRKPRSCRQLIDEARLDPAQLTQVQGMAAKLAEGVRASRIKAGGVDALMHEFSLDSDEGVALMCLAEALLRIPDTATRDRLIRDKIGRGDWRAHVGSLAVAVRQRRGLGPAGVGPAGRHPSRGRARGRGRLAAAQAAASR